MSATPHKSLFLGIKEKCSSPYLIYGIAVKGCQRFRTMLRRKRKGTDVTCALVRSYECWRYAHAQFQSDMFTRKTNQAFDKPVLYRLHALTVILQNLGIRTSLSQPFVLCTRMYVVCTRTYSYKILARVQPDRPSF